MKSTVKMKIEPDLGGYELERAMANGAKSEARL